MEDSPRTDRRGFISDGIRVAGAIGLAGLGGLLAVRRGQSSRYVWQLDPNKCIACGRCQVNCVLDVSAVKAVQCFALCGNCDICTGYLTKEGERTLDTRAEGQRCPTGAVVRTFIKKVGDTRYFEYTINESLCIGCGKCVVGCAEMNKSLYLQVRHDRCLNCNECSIAVNCPTQAYRRVPADQPNLLRDEAVIAEKEMAERRQRGKNASLQPPKSEA